eukprot:203592-Prorocentrum_minimum.AAC.3
MSSNNASYRQLRERPSVNTPSPSLRGRRSCRTFRHPLPPFPPPLLPPPAAIARAGGPWTLGANIGTSITMGLIGPPCG